MQMKMRYHFRLVRMKFIKCWLEYGEKGIFVTLHTLGGNEKYSSHYVKQHKNSSKN